MRRGKSRSRTVAPAPDGTSSSPCGGKPCHNGPKPGERAWGVEWYIQPIRKNVVGRIESLVAELANDQRHPSQHHILIDRGNQIIGSGGFRGH